MTDPLPKREADALSFIVRTARKTGSPPTLRQIAGHLKIASPNTARLIVLSLAEKGYVKSSPDRRAIQLTDKGLAAVGIPVIGTVPAGTPVLAVENYLGVLNYEGQYGDLEGLFALRVKGWSMRDAGIRDGDYVIVRQQEKVEGGEIGVAFKGEEATVKRIHKLKTGWKLEGANPEVQPMTIPWDDRSFRIGGKVVGVFRKV